MKTFDLIMKSGSRLEAKADSLAQLLQVLFGPNIPAELTVGMRIGVAVAVSNRSFIVIDEGTILDISDIESISIKVSNG